MKTQTHTPWIEGMALIRQDRELEIIKLEKQFPNLENAREFTAKVANNATYITDQFIIGMIRSAKRG